MTKSKQAAAAGLSRMRTAGAFPLAVAALCLAAACGGPAADAPAPDAAALESSGPEPAAPPAIVLPEIDAAAITATLTPDDTLQALAFDPAGSTTVTGTVDGGKAVVWAVPVAAGQTLKVDFSTTSNNLYFNVKDAADTSGAAVHRGEVDGVSASILATAPTVYLVQPFQPRALARRGETGDYSITITRN